MTIHRVGASRKHSVLYILFAISTFLVLPLNSYASEAWTGVLTDGTKVELEKGVTIDRKKYDFGLHYEGPWNCRIGAKEISTENNIIRLNIAVTSGGRCDRLYNGNMSIQLHGNTPQTVIIESTRGEKQEIKLK